MHKYGLKLFSINENYVKDAVKLYNEGFYEYIELYIVPESYQNFINIWKNLDIPYIIHAPHFRNGMNLADSSNLNQNIRLSKETKLFADELNADFIIYHPGIAGDIKETVKQLNIIDDKRIVIENKPYFTVLNDGNICNGHSPEEIKYVLDNANVGFCLDIGHCFCAANARKINQIDYLKQFLEVKPNLFHLTDNDFSSSVDKHFHFGEGNYDLEKIFELVPDNALITIETVKNNKENLDDFIQDIKIIKSKTNHEFNIRPANSSDMLNVFNLSNDEEVRKNSFNMDKIELESHKKWYNAKINSSNTIFYIVTDLENKFIGYSRFDNDYGNWTITIHLVPDMRGKGLGSKIIKKVSNKILTNEKINKTQAYVKQNNQASLRAFEKAGYVIVGNSNIHGVNCYKLEYCCRGN